MSLFFKSSLDIDIRLDDEESRRHVEIKSLQGRIEKLPIYKDGETVKGTVVLRTKEGKKVEHLGVKVQLLGLIETNIDGIITSEFLSLATELAAPSQLSHSESYPFEFKNVEKQYESYKGKNARLKYSIKVTVSKKSSSEVTKEKELWVYSYSPDLTTITDTNSVQNSSKGDKKGEATQNKIKNDDLFKSHQESSKENSLSKPNNNKSNSVKMDVGIEDCLHIEFEYSKAKFSLKDVIIGKIYFLLVRLKIKHMELSLIRRETVGSSPNQVTDSETVVRFEIMDGAPIKGETIPIRLFLSGFDLTPTYKDINKKFSTRTYLSLVLIDEDARRYFKQSEIILFRDQ